MVRIAFLIVLATTSFAATAAAAARQWTDATGHYSVEADLIAFNDTTVVLKKENHGLVAVPIEKLSAEDQQYLQSQSAVESVREAGDAVHTWTLRGGMKVRGKVVDYGRREIVIQRRYGKVYVNDQLFDNLPEVYREMVPQIVSHFENADIDGKKDLEAWLVQQKGGPREFVVEGVLLELENGNLYGVPFFMFSEQDQKVLKPGWERWLAAEKDRQQQEQQSFLLQSQAQAYQRDRQAMQQIQQLQLQLQAYDAGLFDLWEVSLDPVYGNNSMPLSVVVPGRNSQQAANAALQRYPGYGVGSIAKVRRRN